MAYKEAENCPTPYEESTPENDNILDSFHTGEGTQGRVSVDEEGDIDDRKEFDNPSYGTVGRANDDEEVAGIDNPAYDAQLTPDVSNEVEEIDDDVSGMEGDLECASEV